MLNLKIYDLNTKHYENWLELYLQYAQYYKVEIPSDKFKLTWKWLNNKDCLLYTSPSPRDRG